MAQYQVLRGGNEGEEQGTVNTDPAAMPDTPSAPDLTPEDLAKLAGELEEVLLSYESAIGPRHKRYDQFEKTWELTPDASSSGDNAWSERLMTELTRSHCNTAQARITEQIIGLSRPWVRVEAVHGEALEGAEQEEVLAEAKARTEFLHAYNRDRVNLDKRLTSALGYLVKLGNCFLRMAWKIRSKERRYLDTNMQEKWIVDDLSGIVWENIHPKSFMAWPIEIEDLSEAQLVGHRSQLTTAEFRSLCLGLGMASAEIETLIEEQKQRESVTEERPKASDTRHTPSPYDTFDVWELWAQMPLPGVEATDEKDPRGTQIFFLREPRKILKICWNPIWCGRHPYFSMAYWPLPGTWLGDGIAHELIFRQKADDALRCIEIDSLKATAANLNLVDINSSLWTTYKSKIEPGALVATENVKDDFASVALGTEVEKVQEARRQNRIEAMEADGITAPSQGFGDPTLKSGASPSSLQMLLTESGKKLGLIDRSIRESLDEIFSYQMELIQQFASSDLYYNVLPEASAREMVKAKIAKRPGGDLRKKWKIVVLAPSAEANPEVSEQKALIFYNFSVQHIQLLLQSASQVWGQSDPGQVQRIMEESLVFLHALFQQLQNLARLGPVGANPPKIEKQPEDELRTAVIQLRQFMEQLQGQLEQAQQENQALKQMVAQPQPQMPMMPQGMPPEGMMPPGPPQGGI